MPTYAYHCDNCEVDHTLLMVPIEERDLQQCPICTRLLVRKMAFTGSVWSPSKSGSNHS